jgi:hypothetical protein
MHFCKKCDKQTVHLIDSVNHLLHWILVFISAGLWFIPYLFIVLFVGRERHCTLCGKESFSLGIGTIVVSVILLLNYSTEIEAEIANLLLRFKLLADSGWNFFLDSIVPLIILLIAALGTLMVIVSFIVGFFARPIDDKLRLERSTHNLTTFYWFSYFTGLLFIWISFLFNFLT